MEKLLKILNTFFLAGILAALILIYFKMPVFLTDSELERASELSEEQEEAVYRKLPVVKVIGEIDANVTNSELQTVTKIDNTDPIQVNISN